MKLELIKPEMFTRALKARRLLEKLPPKLPPKPVTPEKEEERPTPPLPMVPEVEKAELWKPSIYELDLPGRGADMAQLMTAKSLSLPADDKTRVIIEKYWRQHKPLREPVDQSFKIPVSLHLQEALEMAMGPSLLSSAFVSAYTQSHLPDPAHKQAARKLVTLCGRADDLMTQKTRGYWSTMVRLYTLRSILRQESSSFRKALNVEQGTEADQRYSLFYMAAAVRTFELQELSTADYAAWMANRTGLPPPGSTGGSSSYEALEVLREQAAKHSSTLRVRIKKLAAQLKGEKADLSVDEQLTLQRVVDDELTTTPSGLPINSFEAILFSAGRVAQSS